MVHAPGLSATTLLVVCLVEVISPACSLEYAEHVAHFVLRVLGVELLGVVHVRQTNLVGLFRTSLEALRVITVIKVCLWLAEPSLSIDVREVFSHLLESHACSFKEAL
jgi:hypothetical protein